MAWLWYACVCRVMSPASFFAAQLSKMGAGQGALSISEDAGCATQGINDMPEVTIVYWRDIPAQVIVGKGRRGSKRQLAERFEQAIDRAAMKIGAQDTDAYLAEWRKAPPYAMEGDPAEIVEAEAARLEAEFDSDRIKALIANDGWA